MGSRALTDRAARWPDRGSRPRPSLSLLDGVALVVGVVVGAGIFRTPSVVASHAGSESAMLLAWVVGGAISLAGALCYAELAATTLASAAITTTSGAPSAGGWPSSSPGRASP